MNFLTKGMFLAPKVVICLVPRLLFQKSGGERCWQSQSGVSSKTEAAGSAEAWITLLLSTELEAMFMLTTPLY